MAAVVHSWLAIVIGPLILIFLGFLLVWLVRELLRLSAEHEFPSFESTWGGLGRGLGGWSMNRMMVIAVLTFIVLLIFGSVSFELLTNEGGSTSNTEAYEKPGISVQEDKSKATAAGAVNSGGTKTAGPATPAAADGSTSGVRSTTKE
jgi:hypothetical protein